jgi:hypothetical protein
MGASAIIAIPIGGIGFARELSYDGLHTVSPDIIAFGVVPCDLYIS